MMFTVQSLCQEKLRKLPHSQHCAKLRIIFSFAAQASNCFRTSVAGEFELYLPFTASSCKPTWQSRRTYVTKTQFFLNQQILNNDFQRGPVRFQKIGGRENLHHPSQASTGQLSLKANFVSLHIIVSAKPESRHNSHLYIYIYLYIHIKSRERFGNLIGGYNPSYKQIVKHPHM